jgi:hypothetical protein
MGHLVDTSVNVLADVGSPRSSLALGTPFFPPDYIIVRFYRFGQVQRPSTCRWPRGPGVHPERSFHRGEQNRLLAPITRGSSGPQWTRAHLLGR